MIGSGASLALVIGAAAATATLIALLMPTLARYAMARPNARSSHKTPTPQGGGFAVVAVTVLATTLAVVTGAAQGSSLLAALCLAMAVLCVLGGIDDVRPLPVAPRFAVQIACAALLVWASGAERALPVLPAWVEAVVLTAGLSWFINLTNFMDGIDGITIAETIPVTAVLAGIGVIGSVGGLTMAAPLALALVGAMLGFAPYNRHVARLFLGDSGSLAIGASMGTLLIVLAKGGHLAAAIILALYYAADATITLARRWRRGEKLSDAHRTHFYQLATQRGFTVPQVTGHIWALNGILAVLAVLSMSIRSWPGTLALLALAGVLVALVLARFERGVRSTATTSAHVAPRTAPALRPRR